MDRIGLDWIGLVCNWRSITGFTILATTPHLVSEADVAVPVACAVMCAEIRWHVCRDTVACVQRYGGMCAEMRWHVCRDTVTCGAEIRWHVC